MIVTCPNCKTRFDLGIVNKEDMPCHHCGVPYDLASVIMEPNFIETIKDSIEEEITKSGHNIDFTLKQQMLQETVENLIAHLKDEYDLSDSSALIVRLFNLLTK